MRAGPLELTGHAGEDELFSEWTEKLLNMTHHEVIYIEEAAI